MELFILYCVFSYLYIGARIITHYLLNKEVKQRFIDYLIDILAWIVSPILLPIFIGIDTEWNSLKK